LPVSTVERLISAITKLIQQEDIDLLMINLTKSRGQDQSMPDMFATIEDIKDGFIVDTMYVKKSVGRYLMDCYYTSVEVLGISVRASAKDMARFQYLMNKLYDGNIRGY